MKIAICVTFYYVEGRLGYLRKTCSDFANFAPSFKAFIVTNTHQPAELSLIKEALSGLPAGCEIHSARDVGHPFLLPWAHLALFRELFIDSSFTHFLYTEDDIYISKHNIDYWIQQEQTLRPFGLIPSFLRYEFRDGKKDLYSTDAVEPVILRNCPRVEIDSDHAFVNLPRPYQGVYFLTRSQMQEHLGGPSSSPDFNVPWEIREKATQGLTWTRVPKGFSSRNVLGYCPKTNQIDEGALIHHQPNNFANHPDCAIGKVKIDELLATSNFWFKQLRFTGRIRRAVVRRVAARLPG